jgi:hypothetical protein
MLVYAYASTRCESYRDRFARIAGPALLRGVSIRASTRAPPGPEAPKYRAPGRSLTLQLKLRRNHHDTTGSSDPPHFA